MNQKKSNAHNLIMIIFIAFLCFCIGFLLARLEDKQPITNFIKARPGLTIEQNDVETAFKTGCFQTYTATGCKELNITELIDSLYVNWRAE